MSYVVGGNEIHQKYKLLHSLTPPELVKWCEDENQFWNDLYTEYRKHHSGMSHAVTNAIIGWTTALTNMINRGNNLSDKEIIDNAEHFSLPFHDEPISNQIKHYASNTLVLDSAITFYKLALDAERNSYTKLYTQKYEELESKLKDRISDLLEQFNTDRQSSISAIKKSEQEAAKGIQDKIAAAQAAVSLSEPVEFWESRKEIHAGKARKYGIAAICTAFVFLLLLTALIVLEYNSGEETTILGLKIILPQNKFGIALLLLLTTAGVWVTRILVKLMMANLTLESESLERATMIKTFVAMRAVTGVVEKENETLFYTTLFRPSNSALSEDGTAPEFARLIEAVLKKN